MLNTLFSIVVILLLLFFIYLLSTKEMVQTSLGSFYQTTILKGIAITIIVISHVSQANNLRIFTPLGGIGVSIFLICSGYGLYLSYLKNGLSHFFKKRFIKLLIPYWIAYTVYTLVNYSDFNIKDYFTTLFLINTDNLGVFWFVQYIAIFYIFFYITFKFVPEKFQILTLYFLSITTLLFFKDLLHGEQTMNLFIGVLFGKNINRLKYKINKKTTLFYSVLFIIIGLFNFVIKQFPFIRDSDYFIQSLNGILFKTSIAIVIILLSHWFIKSKLFSIFYLPGIYSYEIYLVHGSIWKIMKNVNVIRIILMLTFTTIGSFLLNKLSNLSLPSKNKVS